MFRRDGDRRRALLLGSAGLAGLVLAAGLVVAVLEIVVDIEIPFISRGGVGDPTANAARQESPPPFRPVLSADDVVSGDDVEAHGRLSLANPDPVSTGLDVEVTVEWPAGAEAMQLSIDPLFNDGEWQPLEPHVWVPVGGAGYRTVFGRFRMPDGVITPTIVVGASVDPTWTQAISANPTGEPDGADTQQPSWVRVLSSTEVVVRVEAGRIVTGGLEAYDLNSPLDGDRVDTGGSLTATGPFSTAGSVRVVWRDGAVYGMQVSQRTDVIRLVDRLLGAPLDVDAVTSGQWSVSAVDDRVDDSAYADDGVAPVAVTHLARPGDGGTDVNLDRIWTVVHDFVITLPEPMQSGVTYTVAAPTMTPIEFVYDTARGLSPAVRVNQAGYETTDPLKVGYLAGFFDGIGSTALDGPRTFTVYRTATDPSGRQPTSLSGQPAQPVTPSNPSPDDYEAVLTGTATLRPGDNGADTNEPEGRGDLTGSPVYELDFSDLSEPGRYVVCVDEVGCSYPFPIDDHLWDRLTATVARALYHQRSGIELGPPYTPVIRPRPHHPADGMVVEASDYSLFEAQTTTDNTDFQTLTDRRTGVVLDNAWGGHMDAGDWDRRINHLHMVTNVVHALQANPALADLELNIPESGDRVPDLLDEALWSLDFYRRLQTDEGGIRGGVESSEHPPLNATSWTDDLALFAYQPDIWSSYLYASAAAQTADVLTDYDPDRAEQLLASALTAMSWADQQREAQADDLAASPGRLGASSALVNVDQQRTSAAAALLLATGDEVWHETFLSTADYLTDGDPYLSCHAHVACDSAWTYLQADESVTDPAIRQVLLDRFRFNADALVDQSNNTAYGWTTENPFVPLVWGLGMGGAPNGAGLVKAYALTGDERYRSAALRSAAVSLGANPQNRSMITGVGMEPVAHPQIEDSKAGGLATWAGTPVYGAHTLDAGEVGSVEVGGDAWVVNEILRPAGAQPDPRALPYLWQWYDVDSIAPFNEFTVHQSHGQALLVFGLLAGD